MNSVISKTSESHRFKWGLTDKLNLKDPKKMALANLSIYYTWKNIRSEYKNNKFKYSAPNWKNTFNLPDGSCYIAGIQDHFEFIIKKRNFDWKSTSSNLARTVFKIKIGYKLEFLTPKQWDC